MLPIFIIKAQSINAFIASATRNCVRQMKSRKRGSEWRSTRSLIISFLYYVTARSRRHTHFYLNSDSDRIACDFKSLATFMVPPTGPKCLSSTTPMRSCKLGRSLFLLVAHPSSYSYLLKVLYDRSKVLSLDPRVLSALTALTLHFFGRDVR